VARIFQIDSPVLCATLHPNQAQLFIGDQSGIIHIWDVKTKHSEQLVSLTRQQPSKVNTGNDSNIKCFILWSSYQLHCLFLFCKQDSPLWHFPGLLLTYKFIYVGTWKWHLTVPNNNLDFYLLSFLFFFLLHVSRSVIIASIITRQKIFCFEETQ
jgi:WD40 repeat protein